VHVHQHREAGEAGEEDPEGDGDRVHVDGDRPLAAEEGRSGTQPAHPVADQREETGGPERALPEHGGGAEHDHGAPHLEPDDERAVDRHGHHHAVTGFDEGAHALEEHAIGAVQLRARMGHEHGGPLPGPAGPGTWPGEERHQAGPAPVNSSTAVSTA
jgi:hypothetical protein